MTPQQQKNFLGEAAIAALGPLLTIVRGEPVRAAKLAWDAAEALLAEAEKRAESRAGG